MPPFDKIQLPELQQSLTLCTSGLEKTPHCSSVQTPYDTSERINSSQRLASTQGFPWLTTQDISSAEAKAGAASFYIHKNPEFVDFKSFQRKEAFYYPSPNADLAATAHKFSFAFSFSKSKCFEKG